MLAADVLLVLLFQFLRSMAAPLRTFLALEIPQGVRDAAARLMERLKTQHAKVRWTEPHNLHVTLKFLGDVDVTSVSAVCDAVSRATESISPFRVAFSGAGAFPDVQRPRVLWLGVKEGVEPLVEMHAGIEKQLAELTYPYDGRRFAPHVTLGRVRGPGHGLTAQLEKDSEFPAGDMLVEEVVVFSSELTREGPLYTPMGRAELSGK